MRRGGAASATAAIVAALLAACGGMIPAAEAGDPPFPECAADAYSFVGESSLAALGLAEMWPERANAVGELWITAGPPDPDVWPLPPGEPPVNQPIACLEFDDGSGMAGPVPVGWTSPVAGLAIPTEAGSPIALLAVVVAAVIVVGVSLLAFGWRPRGAGGDRS